ncbi:MAG: hypothetical protein ACREQ9_22025 [Candidatus Binatia bacterium]
MTHGATLPLFEAAHTRPAGPALDVALAVIDRDLAIWEGLRRRAELDPRLGKYRTKVTELGRDLRSLRDCCLLASHPRVRRALLREADAVTRRMRALGSRFRLRGLDTLPLEHDAG